jgi:hypothetical protein
MNIYYMIVSYDSKLFKKFMLLSKGMRKHLLFFVMDELKTKIIEQFKHAYDQYFDFESQSLSLTPISSCKENGIRLDSVIKFKLNKQCRKFEGKSVQFAYTFDYQSTFGDKG